MSTNAVGFAEGVTGALIHRATPGSAATLFLAFSGAAMIEDDRRGIPESASGRPCVLTNVLCSDELKFPMKCSM
jgi:hypothetical protein